MELNYSSKKITWGRVIQLWMTPEVNFPLMHVLPTMHPGDQFLMFCLTAGIMAILFCGIVMSHYTHFNLSPMTQITVQQIFRTTAFMAGMFNSYSWDKKKVYRKWMSDVMTQMRGKPEVWNSVDPWCVYCCLYTKGALLCGQDAELVTWWSWV